MDFFLAKNNEAILPQSLNVDMSRPVAFWTGLPCASGRSDNHTNYAQPSPDTYTDPLSYLSQKPRLFGILVNMGLNAQHGPNLFLSAVATEHQSYEYPLYAKY